MQYDADGRRVRGGNVDRLYTRTEWQARTGEWRLAAQYSETSAAYELTVWLHNVAPTVRSMFVVLSAAAPLRTLPLEVLARDSFSLSALVRGVPGEDPGEVLLCDGLHDMSWWRRMAIDRRASDDTALVLCRMWRSSRGEISLAHATPGIDTHAPCEWVFEEMTLGTFGRVGVCADHYAPIYATLEAWVAAQPLFFCAEDYAAARAAVNHGLVVDETGNSGDFRDTSRVGRVVLSNGDVFVGEWRGSGERHGQGSYIWAADGSRYDGGWVRNQREGPCGRMRYANGDVYQGEWRADKRWGRGAMYFAGGARYEGQWVNDAMDGEGVMAYIGGGVYEGGWVDGVREGEGMMLYADGTLYLGSWRHDKRHGRGEISYSHGDRRNEVRYTGEWHDDVRQGEGQMEHAGSGATYSGQWAGRQTLATMLLVPPLAAAASSQPEVGGAATGMHTSGRAASAALFRHLEPNIAGPHQQEPLGVHRPRPQSQFDSMVSTARWSRAATHTTSPSEAEPSAIGQHSPPQQRRPSPPLLHRRSA